MGNRNYWFWLNQIHGIGNTRLRHLLEAYDGNPQNVYMSSAQELESLGFLHASEIEDICSDRLRTYTWELLKSYEETGIRFVTPDMAEYPHKLQNLYDKPYILYYRGNLPNAKKKSVAIVGSRRCSEYGRSVAREIGRELGACGIEVISGLAMGIDAEAHRGALAGGGRTYGVLAGDAMKCYPVQNFNLYMEMIEQGGGVMSENPPGTAYHPGLFPLRNRIISGLADAVIIVEAGHKSGSLITANLALDQNRDIYAVPGRMGDPSATGCNELIGEGATIISSMEKLLFDLGIQEKSALKTPGKDDSSTKKLDCYENISLAPAEKLLYSLLLDFNPRSLETLIHAAKLSAGEVLKGIVGLEMAGYVREVSKNFYVRVR